MYIAWMWIQGNQALIGSYTVFALQMEYTMSSAQKPWLGILPTHTSLRFESPRRKSQRFMVSARTAHSLAAAKALRERRPQNTEGEFYVDNKCIDCDTCRWMASGTFKRIDGMSAVYNQPGSAEERLKALQALLSCPTASIHAERPPSDIFQVHKTFPLPIDDQSLPGVYHCGYHSEKSYGATSYLIIHSKGNILVDSPRYTQLLAHNIECLGGARYMFLTHRDDVADHDKWAKRLQCDRILHMHDVEVLTADVEMKLEGQGPWSIGPDFDIIFTPGHTKGSVSLHYKPLKALFTGDHLANSTENNLSIMEKYNWDSVTKQLESVRSLLALDFLWILPGHGRRIQFKDFKEKHAALEKCLASSVDLPRYIFGC